MKKIILSLTLAFVAMTSGFAQYYGGEPVGTVYEYEITNPLMGNMKSTYTLESVDNNKLAFKMTTSVPGLAEPMVINNVLTIADGKAYQDPQSVIDSTKASMQATLGGADMDIKLDGEVGFLPLVANVGDKFPLNKYTVKINTMGMEIKSKADVTKYEVIREEEITTPAGTFQTFVVEMEMKTTTEAMGQTQAFDTKQLLWIVPNKGVVKTEQTMSGQTVITTLVGIK